MNKPIPKKHLKFIELVSKGETFERSYQQAININSTAKSCRESGSKLAKIYSNEIASTRDNYQKDITAAKSEEVVKSALKSILSVIEVDAKLCSIIDGSFETVEMVVVDGGTIPIIKKPTATEVRGAIDIYYKRFGNYAATKNDVEISTPVINFIRANRNAGS